ncbi:UvrD-helicase domain-containing protein [Pantoea piersonii]|uniref:UvrD-helicase domain-containing protein n=1 Tax=Pantoea piersonii TaxID=2364647 RepID=UPI000EA21685|nr:ATP-dependent helicase [Pantoea piersonii]MBZ6385942.1 ATP-dependent helicase [Pantoea piersonii]MBZ6399461.1 ATP-dependent helicase [Pantoea piersonii]MBZ6408016.1 ATP-dependent helicase [Pantoea piersonii]MBZ6427061.1 ATP-dependent helicase [Pantoea piersonii]NYB04467.1 ATP-dependent helicase [Pantoea piersonii]
MKTLEWTSEQKAAMEYHKSMVITACPGSGKTTVMKEIIRNVTKELPEHKGVIAITFTKKASSELEEKSKFSAHNTKQSFFGTIDSFCLREIIIPFLNRIWGGNPSNCKVLKKIDLPYSNFIKKNYAGSPTLSNINSDSGYKKLYDEGYLWMGSFSSLALKILNESKSAQRYVKARYSHIFIDEYQDCSLSQHELFLKINELGLTSIVVGDVWQSIYEFRGGDSKLLSQLIGNKVKFGHFELNINHRCHPSIVNYASRLINHNCNLLEADSINIFRKRLDGNLSDVAAIVSKWIDTWLDKKEWGIEKLNQIAILARKDKSLELFCSGFKHNYRLYCDTPLDKIDSQCADVYKYSLLYKYGTITSMQEVLLKVDEIITINDVIKPAMRKILKRVKVINDLQSIINDLASLVKLLGVERTFDEDKAVSHTLSSDIFLNQYKPLDESEVQVMNLHKSKGLEFKVVIHLDMDEWSFPYRIPNDQDRNSPLYPSLQQELNLHYVGITRAEKCCVLINASLRMNKSGGFSTSTKSYFMSLPQLNELYRE